MAATRLRRLSMRSNVMPLGRVTSRTVKLERFGSLPTENGLTLASRKPDCAYPLAKLPLGMAMYGGRAPREPNCLETTEPTEG